MTISLLNNFRFPIAGWIILIHELLERFSFYGMKSILALYLNVYLGFDEDTSTIIYHLFTGFAYLSPIFGAIVSDNYLGRFKTILVVGLIYLIGHLMMPFTAIRKNTAGPLIGMCILAFGAGGIKSSVAAFGGDQLPQGNDDMVEKFFSLFYTSINIGALIAQFLTPILRSDVSCVDQFCYPLAFGVPAASFLLTYVIFIAGTRKYNIVPRSKNVLSKFVGCVYTAVRNYIKERKVKKFPRVMDYARVDYDDAFIGDCVIALRIMVIFTPIPVFWALYDQQGSRWTLQAKNMDGRIGPTYSMKPDQIQAFNALFIIALIPVFDFIIYPVCNKMKMLIKPTSKLITSYTVAAIAFVVAAILQMYIVKGQRIDFSSMGSKFSLMNTVEGCNVSGMVGQNIVGLSYSQRQVYDVPDGKIDISVLCNTTKKYIGNVPFTKYQMKSGVVYLDSSTSSLMINVQNVTVRSLDGYGYVRSFSTLSQNESDWLTLKIEKTEYNVAQSYAAVPAGKYTVYCKSANVNMSKCGVIDIIPGLMASFAKSSERKLLFFKEFEPRLIHMLWQLPQYILITGAEILCSITALSFAYSESPESMKSLMQAVYLLTIFGGNIIVVLVAAVGRRISQTNEFLIFAALVLIAGLVNWLLITKFWQSRKIGDRNNAKMSS